MDQRKDLMARLHLYASKHRDDQYAAEALMSFFRGACLHFAGTGHKCELCGCDNPNRTKN